LTKTAGWIRGSGSVPKVYPSATLLKAYQGEIGHFKDNFFLFVQSGKDTKPDADQKLRAGSNTDKANRMRIRNYRQVLIRIQLAKKHQKKKVIINLYRTVPYMINFI
jgi:hypothetical protein